MRIIRVKFVLFFVGLTIIFAPCNGLSVGSTSVVSVQARPLFPAVDTDNMMLGFASFENGFKLADATTTCTFDSEFSIENRADLSGGALYLTKNLTFDNPSVIYNGGRIYGNNHALEFSQSSNQQTIPLNNNIISSVVSTTSSANLGGVVFSVDWSYDGKYLAAGQQFGSGVTELKIFYFDGSTLTTTQTLNFSTSQGVNAVRWHPSQYYLALGLTETSTTLQTRIYYLNVSNGTFSLKDSQFDGATGDNIQALAWHKSGTYLATGKRFTPNHVTLYSFSLSTETLTQVSTQTFMSPNREIRIGALNFGSQSNFLTVGTELPSSGNAIVVYDISTGVLVSNAGINPGFPAYCVDYSPTGSYVAAALSGGTNDLIIYKHDPVGGTLTQVATAAIAGTTIGRSVKWNRTGEYLLFGLDSVGFYLYYFDQSTKTLNQVATVASLTAYDMRWTSDERNFAVGTGSNTVNVYQFGYINPFLKCVDTTMVLNSPVQLGSDWKFLGQSKIRGENNILTIPPGFKIQVYPNSSLLLEDITIVGLSQFNLECLADNSSITLRNSVLKFSRDYTFSFGTLNFEEDVLLSGTVKFSYAGDNVCTIRSGAIVSVDVGMTFSYSPSIANKQLLFFEDQTAALYLNNCTLYSTVTGLKITSGSLFFDNKVTISSEARNSGEALELGSGVNTVLLSGAFVDIFGRVIYV